MTCPHCLVAFHASWVPRGDCREPATGLVWTPQYCICAACQRVVIRLARTTAQGKDAGASVVYPKASARPISADVGEPYAKDFEEACLVLADSPKASAALSRRCLQHLLREQAKVKPTDLSKEIDQVLDSKQLPRHLASAIDAVRQIGNFGTHPIKSTNSGEVVDVEPGEAEWLLDTLEELFDFYFVQPADLQRKRDALNAKLADAGKPPLK